MSETTPERPARGPQAPPAGRSGAGAGFSRKIGPLPVWGWVTLAAAGGVGYLWWRKRHGAASGSTASTATTTATSVSTTAGVNADAASVLQSEIEQLQGAQSTDADTTTTKATTGHKAVTANGRESLNKIAAANGSSAAAIAEYTLTNKKSISAALRKYLTGGNYQARVPKGLVFWVPTTKTGS